MFFRSPEILKDAKVSAICLGREFRYSGKEIL